MKKREGFFIVFFLIVLVVILGFVIYYFNRNDFKCSIVLCFVQIVQKDI